MFKGFADCILRGIVDADVNTANIFTDEPQHHQNEASHKKDGGDNGTPAHLNGRVNQLSDDHIKAVAKTKKGGGCSA